MKTLPIGLKSSGFSAMSMPWSTSNGAYTFGLRHRKLSCQPQRVVVLNLFTRRRKYLRTEHPLAQSGGADCGRAMRDSKV